VPSAPRGEAPESTPGFEPRLARLSDLIEQFRIDSERYFNGALPIPPEELKLRVQRALRDLRSVNLRSAAEIFRLGGLEARFNVLSENVGRRLREREEGRGVHRPVETAAEPARYDPEAGIVLGRAEAPEAVEALFAGLARRGAAAKLDLESFRGYLARQIEEIRAKTGAEQVQFRLTEEQGKVKLKARPVGPGGEGGGSS
jgi:hypothetical protein